ncbi:MAG TPA: PKD domain-containing protein [Candidatus Thermoplasmatota archaeon]|jgi:PKD repeat protein|nr:PKD domain-containing protein [Candidatus Thermoplasmatota archaeon]
MHRAIPVTITLLALAMAGCTSQPAQPNEPLEPTGTDQSGTGSNTTTGTGNNTTLPPPKPPVARMQVFDTDGALAFESNFVADNATATNPLHGGAPVTFLGSNSEAVDKTATVTKWEWDFGDGGKASGRGVSHGFRDVGGIFRVTLVVTDSHNLTDSVQVLVGVLPTRSYTVPLNASGELQLGTLGLVQQDGLDVATTTFELVSTMEGQPVRVESVSLTVAPDSQPLDPLADYDVYVYDPDGNLTAADVGGALVGAGEPAPPSPGSPASVSLPAGAAPGVYTVKVVLHFGALSQWILGGEAVYRVVNPQVEAQFAGGP